MNWPGEIGGNPPEPENLHVFKKKGSIVKSISLSDVVSERKPSRFELFWNEK
jgi:hypothetical protein